MKKATFVFVAVVASAILALNQVNRVEAADRIAAIFTNGDVWVKEGAVNASWNQITNGVTVGDLDLTGDWITLLDATENEFGTVNDVSIKEPFVNSEWSYVYAGVGNDAKQVATTKLGQNYRFMVLATSGDIFLKDGVKNSGFWSGSLKPSTGTIKSIYTGGNRIFALMTDGKFLGKDLTDVSHPNNIPWSLLSSDVTDAAVSENRIAMVLTSGAAYAKEGSLNSGWAYVFDSAKKILVTDTKLCSIQVSNNLICKQGGLGATAVLTYTNVREARLSNNRYAVVTPSNSAFVMQGTIYGNPVGWQFVGTENIKSLEIK